MKEIRLIDANALKEDLFIKFGNQLPNGLLDEIDNSPIVDLWEMRQEATENALKKAEVLYARPKGKWVKSKDGYTRCDQCGSRGSAIKARFCHHCGAEMRGTEHGD